MTEHTADPLGSETDLNREKKRRPFPPWEKRVR